MDTSYAEFCLNRTKNADNRAEFMLRPCLERDFHCTDFHYIYHG
jgi:hypothetical protein